jgi:D-xylose transport system substrate-binding protein
MRKRVQELLRAVAVVAAGTVVASTAGCAGSSAAMTAPAKPAGRIAFLLPHAGADRYEAMDQPYFALRVQRLCPSCDVDYRNAGNKQDVQNQQAQDALDKGAKVLVVDAVDSGHATAITDLAKARHVPVISYDRLILGAPLDYYVSFDNVNIGQIAGNALVQAIGPKAATGSVLWVNGPPADNNAVLYKQGAHQAMDGKVTVAAEFTMPGPGYDPKAVDAWIKKTIPTLKLGSIVGVYCVDDSSAGIVAAALRAAGVGTLPPIIGHNADIAGMQRMLVGQQYATVYKPVVNEAERAAELAYDLLRGQHPAAPSTIDNRAGQQPAVLLPARVITRDDLKSTVLKDGFVTVGAVCAASYTDACAQAGIG